MLNWANAQFKITTGPPYRHHFRDRHRGPFSLVIQIKRKKSLKYHELALLHESEPESIVNLS